MRSAEAVSVALPTAADSGWDWTASAARIDQLNRTSPHQALALASAWLAAEAEGGSPGGYARARRSEAHALRFVGRYEAALEGYQQAEQRFLLAGDEPEAARTRIGRVTALKYLGRYAEAIALAQQTRAYFLAHGDELQAAKQANNLGTIYRPMGQLAAALRSYQAARRVFRRLGERSSLADVEQNIGNVLKELGRYEQAISHLRAAERIRRSLGLQAEVARTLLNLGALHQRRGDYGRALQALLEARGLYESLGLQQNVAMADLDLLPVYLALNLRDESQRTAERAVQSLRQLELPFELGQALLAAAMLAEASGDEALARQQTAEARELFTRLGNRLWEAMAELREASLASTGEAEAELEPALASCRAATERLLAAEAPDRAAAGGLLEGVLLARLGRFEEALGCFQRVIAAAHELNADQLLYQAHASVGELLEEAEPDAAVASYRLALDHLEAVRARTLADDLKLSFLADKTDLYERLVALLLLDSDERAVAAAFAVVERSKSRTLLEELLAGAGAAGGRRSRLEQLRRRVRDIRARLNTLYAGTYSGDQTPTAEMVEQSSQGQQVARLEEEFAQATRDLQLAARADSAGPSEVGELGALAASLPDDTALVEFYTAGPDLVAFIGRAGQLQFRCLATLDEVADLAERLTFHLGDGAFGTEYVLANLERLRRSIDQALQALWWQVVAPLEELLVGVRRLVVVPHGPLHSLPFHAFRDGEGHYLLERFTIGYAPSFGIYQAAQSAARPLGERAVVVGVDDPNLPWVEHEVASVAAAWPSPQVLSGPRATIGRLRRLAGRFDTLHLATHAVFRADNPLFSSLKLADGWLTVSDLSELARGAQLVTLSACETGLSGLAVGDEVLGLTRGILGAGCSTVVASLWPVTDETTALLMIDFYAALRTGLPPAEALRQAMLSLRERYDHPYFWAPFISLGAG